MKCHKCEHPVNMHRITIENGQEHRTLFVRCFDDGLGCTCDMSFNQVVIPRSELK